MINRDNKKNIALLFIWQSLKGFLCWLSSLMLLLLSSLWSHLSDSPWCFYSHLETDPHSVPEYQVVFLDAAVNCGKWQCFSKVYLSPWDYIHHGVMTVCHEMLPEEPEGHTHSPKLITVLCTLVFFGVLQGFLMLFFSEIR